MTPPLKQLALDAGPLIALFYAKDTYHTDCRTGFEQLNQMNTRLLTPLPILFEVYKWLLQNTTPTAAQTSLNAMIETLDLVVLRLSDFLEIHTFIQSLPTWQGSLEDATVIWLTRQYQCPVWTLNYRDFGSFASLEFWTPDLS